MEEREVKLLLDRSAKLPEPAVLFDGIGEWTWEQVEQDAVYFDTVEFALARAGASLRFRSDDGWTVKIPRPRAGDALVRDELTLAAKPGSPPRAAVDLVRAWARSHPVVEVARVHTERRRYLVVDTAGEPLLEVDDDRVTADATGRRTARFREVEIESRSERGAACIDRVVDRLRATGAEPGDGIPKVVRALGPRAQAPPDLVVPEALARSATVLELVRFTIARGVGRLLDHDPLVRTSDDPEAVHQARVATRRLRSDLRTLRPVLDEGWSEPLRAELQWLGAALGRVRDADVLLERLQAEAEAVPADERTDADALLDVLRAQRERDRKELLGLMNGARYARLLDALVDAAASPRVHPADTDAPARARLRRLLHGPAKRLRRRVGALTDDPPDGDLHEVRKRAKQARYALEAVAPIMGRRATRAADRIADLQEVLGEHQDAVVAAAWLRAAAFDDGRPGVAFVAGRWSRDLDADRRARRTDWPAAWKRARRALKQLQADARV